jgi:hypothetical protein
VKGEDEDRKSLRRSSQQSSAVRRVTPQRKQNNRKAQQRYREKRKAQAASLEMQVVMLTTELESMRAVHSEASKLQDENAELKAALDKQKAALVELQVHVFAVVVVHAVLSSRPGTGWLPSHVTCWPRDAADIDGTCRRVSSIPSSVVLGAAGLASEQ